jgi:hypothetical protein
MKGRKQEADGSKGGRQAGRTVAEGTTGNKKKTGTTGK